MEGMGLILSGFARGCRGYTGDPVRSTAVFVPLRVSREGDRVQIVWSCSLAERCENQDCLYARRARRVQEAPWS